MKYVWGLTPTTLLKQVNQTTIQGMEIKRIISKYKSEIRFKTVSALIRYLYGKVNGKVNGNYDFPNECMLDCMALVRNVFVKKGTLQFGEGMDHTKAWKLNRFLDLLEKNRFMRKNLV